MTNINDIKRDPPPKETDITPGKIILGGIIVVVLAFFFINNMFKDQSSEFDTKIQSLKTELNLKDKEMDTIISSLEIELKNTDSQMSAFILDLNEQKLELNSSKDDIKIIESDLYTKFDSLNSNITTYQSEFNTGLESLNLELEDYQSNTTDIIQDSIDTKIQDINVLLDSEFANMGADIDDKLALGFEDRMNEINDNIDGLIHSLFLLQDKIVTMPYVLRGDIQEIDFTVYKGFSDYLSNIRNINSEGNYDLSIWINHEKQREILLPLVDIIIDITPNKDDQARIAISMVQHILYDHDLVLSSDYIEMGKNKFPYEVVYDQRGICGCKSHLLTFLLKELGYGVVMFDFEEENHRAVGIKCPMDYSYQNTGYCFIESTVPVMITRLGWSASDETPIVEISFEYEGLSFDTILEEYNDAQEYKRLLELAERTQEEYDTYRAIITKYMYWDYIQYNDICGIDSDGIYCDDECRPKCPEGEIFICLPNKGRLCI